MTRISLEQANRMIAAAFTAGNEYGLKPLGAVVVDAGGHTIAFQRQDSTSTHRYQIAAGKAAGALALGVSSRKVGEMAAQRPAFIAALGPILPLGPVPAAGGVIIVDVQGQPIGAIAVTGDSPDNDERCAFAAIAAVGLTPQETPSV